MAEGVPRKMNETLTSTSISNGIINTNVSSASNYHTDNTTDKQPPKKLPQHQEEDSRRSLLWDIQQNSHPVLDYLEEEIENYLETPSVILGNSTLYQQQYCNLQGKPWCPTVSWQQRSPSFMILGCKKAGTTSLYASLTQHSSQNIVSAQKKELHFFSQHDFSFQKYLKSTTTSHDFINDKHFLNTTYQVQVQTLRNDLINKFRRGIMMNYPSKISFDATPQYIFQFPTGKFAEVVHFYYYR